MFGVDGIRVKDEYIIFTQVIVTSKTCLLVK